MDVVPDAGAVLRIVIRAVDFYVRFLAERDLQDIGNQMGFDAVLFAELFRGAGCVEITQRDKSQAVDLDVPMQDFLESQF